MLLVTDGHAAYPAFARAAGISHEAVNAGAGVRTRGALQIQNVSWPWALDGRRIADREAFLRAALGRFNT